MNGPQQPGNLGRAMAAGQQPEDDGPGFLITLRDVWESSRQSEIRLTREIRELRETISAASSRRDADEQWYQRSDAIHRDLESRVRMLERWRYALPGSIIMAVMSLAGLITEIVINLTHG